MSLSETKQIFVVFFISVVYLIVGELREPFKPTYSCVIVI